MSYSLVAQTTPLGNAPSSETYPTTAPTPLEALDLHQAAVTTNASARTSAPALPASSPTGTTRSVADEPTVELQVPKLLPFSLSLSLHACPSL